MRFGIIPLALAIFAFALVFSFAHNSIASGKEKIALVQYNVKGSGGWIARSPNIKYKLKLISGAMPLDFITLEQAGQHGNASPLVSDELAARGIEGWKTITSSCNSDVVQIGYSSSWTLLRKLGSPGSHAAGFGWKGCSPGDDPRGYNIGLFKNAATNHLILLVATHLPHCLGDLTVKECADQWADGADKFRQDAATVLSPLQSNDAVVIIAGDMNEVGKKATDDALSYIFTFQNLKKSANQVTCCRNDGWRNSFDHVATTGPAAPTVEVKEAPKDDERYFATEEHRMIISEVLLSF